MPSIWIVASLTYDLQTRVCLFRNMFSLRAIFVRRLHIFLNPISTLFCNFSLQLNMANRKHIFSAVGDETEEKVKLAKNKIQFDS